jgi:hypothetical protein
VPAVGNAELSLEGLKEGAAKAAKAVGDTTKGAVDAASEVAGKATRVKLDAMAESTLKRLFAEELGSRALKRPCSPAG